MNTLELLKDNNWFEKHPEKIAGEEYETSGYMFPVMVKGSKEDVLRVINYTPTTINNSDKNDRKRLATAKAKALQIKLKLAKAKKHALNGCYCENKTTPTKPQKSKKTKKGLKSPQPANEVIKPKAPEPKPQTQSSKIASANSLTQNNNTEFWPIGGETGKFLQRVEKKPFHSVVITIDGMQGAGKTTMLYQYVNDFSKVGKTLFATLEQHPSSVLTHEKIKKYISDPARVDMVGDFDSRAEFYSIIEPYDFIFIDSWQKLLEMIGKLNLDTDLRKKFDGKVFVVVFQQTTTGRTKGGAGIVFDGDIIIKMETGATFAENFAYFDKNRYTQIPLNEITYNIAEARTIIKNEAQANSQVNNNQTSQPDFSTDGIQLVELD